MPFFKSLPPDATAKDILRMNKPVGRALVHLHQTLMRGESPLTPAQRELIAAYVSGLNGCQYCFGVHSQTAEALGVPEGELRKMLFDLGEAQIEPQMRPLLEYIRFLTTSPHQLVQAAADVVFAAGWSERALHDAILNACLFTFMNRLLEGHCAYFPCSGSQRTGRARASGAAPQRVDSSLAP